VHAPAYNCRWPGISQSPLNFVCFTSPLQVGSISQTLSRDAVKVDAVVSTIGFPLVGVLRACPPVACQAGP